MSNYLQGMNKSDIIITKTYRNYFKNFKDHFGARVFDLETGKKYIVTNMTYVNRNWDYDVVYQLNENHTRKNNSYQAPQAIRTDTAIPLSGAKERKTFIKQTVKIGLSPVTQEGNNFLVDKKILLSALMPNTVDSKYYPQIAAVYPTADNAPIINPKLLANIAQFTVGKMICINLKFYDNILAGKSKNTKRTTESHIGLGGSTFYIHKDNGDVSSQIPILFTNTFGEISKLKILLSSASATTLSDFGNVGGGWGDNGNVSGTEYLKTENSYKTMKSLPIIPD
ncbi:MAG: hypothetical protein LBP62_07045 [Clostridiales bacterium]|nr:hypothetical protein [Clostridiales bacterium]